jgi:hypothetical protein
MNLQQTDLRAFLLFAANLYELPPERDQFCIRVQKSTDGRPDLYADQSTRTGD